MTTTTTLLAVEDLKTSFLTPEGDVTAVDGVSLQLGRGQTLGIVGESGSGKTVLCRSIMRLLPRTGVRSEGKVLLDGVDLELLSATQLRRVWGGEIGMVFQDALGTLNPVVKIGRQITEVLHEHLHLSRSDARWRAGSLLRSVGVADAERRLSEYPHQLSGGLRQRVTIAMALACEPKLLLADEPTTALDVTVQAQILDLLAAQQRERRMAMVIVTHDLGVVAGRTDEIAVMYAGKIVERAPTKALFADVKMPYTEALLNSMPRMSNPGHTRLQAIAGRPPNLMSPPPGCRFAPRCLYAQPRCLAEEPPLRPTKDPSHSFARWYPVGTPEGQDARKRNRRAGLDAGEIPGLA